MVTQFKTKFFAASAFVILAIAAGDFALGWQSTAVPKSTAKSAVNLNELAPTGIPTIEEKRAVFERVWNLLNNNYPSFKLKVINWQHEKEVYEPKVLNAPTWPRFFQLTEDMIGTLQDGHCNLIGEPLPQEYYPFIFTSMVSNQVVITVAPPASKLKPGTIILGVDGESLNQRLDEPPASLPFHANWFSAIPTNAVLSTYSSKPETLTVMDPKTDAISTVSIPVYQPAAWNQKIQAYLSQHAAYKYWIHYKPVQVKQLNHGILYVGIFSMTGDLKQRLMPYMRQIEQAKGLIIDVRGNGGGDMYPAPYDQVLQSAR